MKIVDIIITGHILDVETKLIKSVYYFTGKYKRVKIGITNNPERRAQEHRKTGKWKKMIVKYHTTSVDYINDIERIIIEHHWDYIENKIAGGGGPNGIGPYYLYFLVS
jgi:hypothetical protein